MWVPGGVRPSRIAQLPALHRVDSGERHAAGEPSRDGQVALLDHTLTPPTHRFRGAGTGAGLGAIAGAVWGGVTASKVQSCRTPHFIEMCSMEWYERATRGGMIGAAVGEERRSWRSRSWFSLDHWRTFYRRSCKSAAH